MCSSVLSLDRLPGVSRKSFWTSEAAIGCPGGVLRTSKTQGAMGALS